MEIAALGVGGFTPECARACVEATTAMMWPANAKDQTAAFFRKKLLRLAHRHILLGIDLATYQATTKCARDTRKFLEDKTRAIQKMHNITAKAEVTLAKQVAQQENNLIHLREKIKRIRKVVDGVTDDDCEGDNLQMQSPSRSNDGDDES